MEKLLIDIPNGKSDIVKQILHSLGVSVPGYHTPVKGNYKKKLLQVSVWSDDDLKPIEDASKSFTDLKAEEW